MDLCVNDLCVVVPEDVAAAISTKALGTARNEKFFILMRRPWPVPYVLQYLTTRSRNILEDAKRVMNNQFSYHLGPSEQNHYSHDGASRAAALYRRIKPRQKAKSAAVVAERRDLNADLQIAHDVAQRAKGKRQAAPGSRGMDQPGAYVDVHWAPQQRGQESLEEQTERAALGNAPTAAKVSGERSRVIYRSGDFETVELNGELRMAQLRNQIIRVSLGTKKKKSRRSSLNAPHCSFSSKTKATLPTRR